jgi:hypothetical protein
MTSRDGNAGLDDASGSWLERAVFGHRSIVVTACLAATLFFVVQAAHVRLNARYESTIPSSHPYAINLRLHQRDVGAVANTVRIAVETTQGSIYDAAYLATLRDINDEVFLLPGVDRPFMRSLWTPNTRWTAVTDEGLEGGPVMPKHYDGSPAQQRLLEANLARSSEVGRLVATDFKSTAIHVPIVSGSARSGVDYAELSRQLETLRVKYEEGDTRIHIVGFAKLAGDLITGMNEVLRYFAISAVIAVALLYAYTRCARSTALVVSMSAVAVVWQLGALYTLGYELDAYSMLVPFLVFAIGVSHGAQKMNGVMQDVARGAHRYVAARRTFRRLFFAGFAALVADAVGFLVLLVIDIQTIRYLAIAASLGVTALIATNLVLLPVLLSYTGVSTAAAERARRIDASAGGAFHGISVLFSPFAQRPGATIACAVATVVALGGLLVATKLEIGDLDPGAPELRADSRYNRDLAYMNARYSAASDVFVVMVKTPDQQCASYPALMRIDALEWQLRQLPFVESTASLALLNRRMLLGLSEANPKWYDLVEDQGMLNTVTASAPREAFNETCGLSTLDVYLTDHKADTLARLVDHIDRFAAANDTVDVRFLMAAGNAGVEAVTNIVVRQAWRNMLLLVYAAVALLVLAVFRSWRVVIVAVAPLMLTSIVAEALMAVLGVGIKVATLPVIVLGVGIGVDYAFYILAVMLAHMREGAPLAHAYEKTMRFTGKVVLLTGTTLAIGVATWVASEIKFQADMGVLLAFMVLVNMLGALTLLPALSYFMLQRRDLTRVRAATSGQG